MPCSQIRHSLRHHQRGRMQHYHSRAKAAQNQQQKFMGETELKVLCAYYALYIAKGRHGSQYEKKRGYYADIVDIAYLAKPTTTSASINSTPPSPSSYYTAQRY